MKGIDDLLTTVHPPKSYIGQSISDVINKMLISRTKHNILNRTISQPVHIALSLRSTPYTYYLSSFMLSSPSKVFQKISEKPVAQSNPGTKSQYGTQHDLLTIPQEVLSRITSYLDPFSLQTISLVNKHFYEHVKDDNTWYHAFVQQFLGIDFENELYESHRRLLLRREAKTWRQEFITRFNLCKWVDYHHSVK